MIPVLRKEFADAVRSRWLIAYAAALAVLGAAAVILGQRTAAGLDLQAYGRTTATLTNLCLFLAPLIALAMGSLSIAGERDRGTLDHLLAQPLHRHEVLLGKYLGLLLALAAATLVGFLPALVAVASSGNLGRLLHALVFPALACLLIAAMLALGVAISVHSATGVSAQGSAIVVWFVLVLLYDLVLIGTLSASGMTSGVLSALLVLNPVDAARVLVVLILEPDLYLLGPAGALLVDLLSRGGAAALLTASIVGWIVGPLLVALHSFALRKPRRRRRPRAVPVAPPDAVGARVARRLAPPDTKPNIEEVEA